MIRLKALHTYEGSEAKEVDLSYFENITYVINPLILLSNKYLPNSCHVTVHKIMKMANYDKSLSSGNWQSNKKTKTYDGYKMII